MKLRLLMLFAVMTLLLSGCASLRPRPPKDLLTAAEAEQLALEHAGFKAEEITGLRTETELEGRFPTYEIEFYRERWKYDYVIHAESGEVLSFEKED